jgi:hypothetical protein
MHEITPVGGFIVAALMAASDVRGTACIVALLLATAWCLVVSD